MSKAKSVASGSFHPWAECLGTDDSQCWWKSDQGPSTRGEAKAHAEEHPGHSVRVVAEKVDLYRAES
jgi:hypothetical protein